MRCLFGTDIQCNGYRIFVGINMAYIVSGGSGRTVAKVPSPGCKGYQCSCPRKVYVVILTSRIGHNIEINIYVLYYPLMYCSIQTSVVVCINRKHTVSTCGIINMCCVLTRGGVSVSKFPLPVNDIGGNGRCIKTYRLSHTACVVGRNGKIALGQ